MPSIPLQLRIFNIIYECRLWVLVPLVIAWFAYAVLLFRQRKKMFFLWLLALPFLILPATVATTWCGWHYRMELRDRFAQNPQLVNAIDIDRMPPVIYAEYARHDYHPRLRDVKAMAIWNLLSFPLVFLAGGIAWCGGGVPPSQAVQRRRPRRRYLHNILKKNMLRI